MNQTKPNTYRHFPKTVKAAKCAWAIYKCLAPRVPSKGAIFKC